MSTTQRPKYRLTPSLLNKFQDLLDSDLNWQTFYGDNDNSEITAEEYYQKCEQELLDACNRVPFSSEPTARGTALNEIVDCILEKRTQREDMVVKRIFDQPFPEKAIPSKEHAIGLHAELEGFSFDFDIKLINELADYFFGSICQHRCEAILDTSFGPVILYGDPDYIRRDVVHELKSTGRYEYGKFERGWQKYVYPWALIESGEVQTISGFEYTVVPVIGGNSRTPLITGTICREWYDYNHEAAKERLIGIVEPFIQWIEDHRDKITHPRIFNQS